MTQRIDGPVAEPLTLAEARAFLRLDATDGDALVSALIAAARQAVETATGRALMHQTWRVTRDAWPQSGVFPLPVAPVAAIIAARVHQADGTTQQVPNDALRLVAARLPPLIHVGAVPAPGRALGGIEIDLRVGYGATAAAVPADLVQAVRLVLAHFHEHRDGPGEMARLPAAVATLIAPYRMVRL
ncbi:phage head-tail connector protein [Xanthobacteraceae bacterium A53D]